MIKKKPSSTITFIRIDEDMEKIIAKEITKIKKVVGTEKVPKSMAIRSLILRANSKD